MEEILKQIFHYVKLILGWILPGGVGKLGEYMKVGLGKKNQKTLREQIKDYYIQHGYDWSEYFNLMTVRDTSHPNTYNDIHIVDLQGDLHFYWGTSEPGRGWTAAKMEKYKVRWVGLYPLGFFPKNFRAGSFHGRALRQVGQIMLMEIKNGKPAGLRKGGGCHFHRRFSKGKYIGVSSAGCQAPKSKENMDRIMDLYEASALYRKDKKHLLDYMIADIKDFPDLTGSQVL